MASLRVTERKAIDPVHPRRALTVGEIGRLLDAAERRPLLELMTIRHGPDKGQQTAKLKEKTKALARARGRERRLVYLLAAWTGLRRSEIRQLTWGDVQLESLPAKIALRAETTKSKRADSLPIHPQLADELKAWRTGSEGPSDFVFSTVPSMKCLRSDLALAGIADKDEAGRYVDFHSLRVSLSTLLAANKVSPRAAQALMRHTDPRLTAGVYTDEKLLPLAAELQGVPLIPTQQIPIKSALKADAQVQSIVAGLTPAQKRSLLRALGQSLAG